MPSVVEALSTGYVELRINSHGLNPGAVAIIAEDGIDIASHLLNNVNEYLGIDFDFILTVYDHANENCPYIP